jgi:hypothetical protein
MMRLLSICSLLVLGTTACGGEGLIQVLGVWPMDGGMLTNVDMSDTTFNAKESDAVDTQQGLCAATDGSYCTPEPFYSHNAVIRIANGYPIDENNPLLGVATVTGFSVSLRSTIDGAPELSGPAGLAQEVVKPQETRNIVLPLVDVATKSAFAKAAGNTHYRYSATYTLRIEGRASLSIGTSVDIGPFNGCPTDSAPVATCPVTATP